MPRTTLDIDATVLRELKRLKKRENRPLGQIVSELLAKAIRAEPSRRSNHPLRWETRSMGAHFDLEDKDRLWRALDER